MPDANELAQLMTRQLPGAISRAYPAVTSRAVPASRKCTTAPRTFRLSLARGRGEACGSVHRLVRRRLRVRWFQSA
jgi:hypothetical protein